MSEVSELRLAIQRHAKLPPERPTVDELYEIIREATRRTAQCGRRLSSREWTEVIARHVSYDGPEYTRKGMDFSDLNALLAVATARLRAASKMNAANDRK